MAPGTRRWHSPEATFKNGRIRTSFGGQWQNKGYELIEELKLVENARRIGEEAVALHKADKCPEGPLT